jgi:hypothetical protein
VTNSLSLFSTIVKCLTNNRFCKYSEHKKNIAKLTGGTSNGRAGDDDDGAAWKRETETEDADRVAG